MGSIWGDDGLGEAGVVREGLFAQDAQGVRPGQPAPDVQEVAGLPVIGYHNLQDMQDSRAVGQHKQHAWHVVKCMP
jgi:hypothetical protein